MYKFIQKAIKTHNGFYDYSKTKFQDPTESTTISCPKHGDFVQDFHAHMNGAECKKCVSERRSEMFRLPLEKFIKRANQIHNYKYDYSKVSYKNTAERITIICPTHGEFQQFASGHLTGYGCRQCSVQNRKIQPETYIERCKVVHNNFYDYSKTKYVDSREKVIITCPRHGDFKQNATQHLGGSKCPKCSNENRYLTTEEFIEKATETHGDLYDYSYVVYKSTREKVRITCREHGEFHQIPNAHLQGAGCPVCALENSRMTTKSFIEKAKLIHGEKYSYHKTIYTSTSNKTTITCPKHGDFEQQPNTHLSGGGCYKCGRDELKMTTEEFIERSKTVHFDRYDYSETTYSTIRNKLTITCSKHGNFEQLPSLHLRGSGCPKCNASKGELTIERILKSNNIPYIPEYLLPEIKVKYRYDFFLPEIRVLIEFHGIQHFEPVGFFGGEDTYHYVVRNDKLKRQFAGDFGYELLEIDYRDFERMDEVEFEKYLLNKIDMLSFR